MDWEFDAFPWKYIQVLTIHNNQPKRRKKTASKIREYTVATEGGTFTLEKTAKRFATEGCIFCPFEKKKTQKRKKKGLQSQRKKSFVFWQ